MTTTSTVALLCATALADAGLAEARDAVADLATLVFLVGAILIGFRLLRRGTEGSRRHLEEPVIPEVPQGLPAPELPAFDRVGALFRGFSQTAINQQAGPGPS